MKIDRAGFPFIAAALVPTVGLAATRRYKSSAGLALLTGFLTYFFRDPERQVPVEPGLVVSPADGRIMIAGPSDGRWAPPGDWLQVTIFLSPMDVHINRIPVSGRVTRVSYTPGRYLPAYRSDAGAVNERSEIWIDHGGQMVVARQIVGMLARRVVCRLQAGAQVAAGDRYGVMKFGSRMDVFVPMTAEIRVKAGDTVRGGETILAMLH